MARTYCIHYGWLCDDAAGEPNEAARRIAAAGVSLVVASFWTEPRTHRNLSPQVLAELRRAGTRVFAYVATRWGDADPGSVRTSALEYLDAGVGGIFLDEAHHFLDASKLVYYREIARLVRDRGGAVIANPGVARCGADVLSVADYVMFEHAWRDVRSQSRWACDCAPERLMGVSSNEAGGMGYPVDAARAIADTHEARRLGIGWHTSTDRYTALPDWFEEYAAASRA
jgi:hypothetical protein